MYFVLNLIYFRVQKEEKKRKTPASEAKASDEKADEQKKEAAKEVIINCTYFYFLIISVFIRFFLSQYLTN